MDDYLRIEQLENGYLLTDVSDNWEEDKVIHEEKTCFEYVDDAEGKSECFAIKRLLWEIINKYRAFSKHVKFNVVVRVEDNCEEIEE